MKDQIQVITDRRRLPVEADALDDHADRKQAAVTRHASVGVPVALVTSDSEFPSAMLKRGSFESVATIATALVELEAAT